jgi:hypothetical protein
VKNEKLDASSAWLEMSRWAAACGVELDCRAHPEYSEDDDTDEEKALADKPDADGDPVGEGDVSDYSDIMRSIRSGHVMIGEGGSMTINWIKPPHGESNPIMILDPDLNGEGWPYSAATRALHTVPIAPAVSKRARKREAVQEDDQLGRMDRFLEVLGEQERGTMLKLRHMLDRDLVTSLSKFILLESRRSH